MEIEDNVQHQLICELMNKLVKVNNRLDKLIDRQEVLFQTSQLEVVEPPSPTYKPPHINYLTYMAQMHNNMARRTPIDDGYNEVSYEDEIDDMNDIESLGVENMNWKKDESPVDSNPTVDGDLGDNLMEESTSNVDSYTVQEPLPILVNEVVPHVHTPSSPTFNHESHLESQLPMLPIPLDCIVSEDDKDFTTCVLENFEIKNSLREDLDTLNDDATQVQSKMMYMEQEFVSFDEIGFDLVLVHEEGHEASITQNLDPSPSIEPWPPPVCKCEYVEHVIGTIHTNDQYENLISNDPLDDALEDFLTSCGPLDTNVASKGVNEWIDFYIEKDLNE